MNFDSKNAEGIETYPNELELLAAADDVVGNGVFDPNNTHGNLHQDEGVFADHQSLPGYLDRERFYGPSEVTDVTTGRPVQYVPGGAVPFYPGQAENYRDLVNLYHTPPRSDWNPGHPRQQSTVIPQNQVWAVGADAAPVPAPLPQPASSQFSMPYWGWLALGFGVGIGATFLARKARR